MKAYSPEVLGFILYGLVFAWQQLHLEFRHGHWKNNHPIGKQWYLLFFLFHNSPMFWQSEEKNL